MSLVPDPDYEDNPNPSALCMGVAGAVAAMTLYNTGMDGIFVEESTMYVDVDPEELRQEVVKFGNYAPLAKESLCYLDAGSAIEDEVLHINSQIGDLYNEMQVLVVSEPTDIVNIESTPECKSCVYVGGAPEKQTRKTPQLVNLPLLIDESMRYVRVDCVTEGIVFDTRESPGTSPINGLSEDKDFSENEIVKCKYIDASARNYFDAPHDALCQRDNPLSMHRDLETKIIFKCATDLSSPEKNWNNIVQLTSKSSVTKDISFLSPLENNKRLDRFHFAEDVRKVIVDYKTCLDESSGLTCKEIFRLESPKTVEGARKIHPMLMDADMLCARRRRGFEWFLG